MSEGPLAGVVVAEFGNLLAAPYAGMLLADLGAEVIKVEPPGGDLARRFGPYQDGESIFFMAVNRGKKSLALDPKDWLSKRILDKLVARADVVLHNLRRGAMERMGLGEDRVREMNPDVVYAVIAAFGADGPYADRAGVDVVFQGESGMISITGKPGDPPQKTATTIGDYLAGTHAALAITAALAERTHHGRSIAVSLRDGLMAVQSGWNAIYFATGKQPTRLGTASPFLAPNQVFNAKDGPFTLAIVSDDHFRRLAEVLERPDLAEGCPTNEQRVAARDELVTMLDAIFATATVEHWVGLLDSAGLPVGRILDLAGAFADPQAVHNEMLVETDHPVAGRVKLTGSPIRVDGAPARATEPPPPLGSDSRQVLAWLGVDEETIDRMVATGAVVVS